MEGGGGGEGEGALFPLWGAIPSQQWSLSNTKIISRRGLHHLPAVADRQQTSKGEKAKEQGKEQGAAQGGACLSTVEPASRLRWTPAHKY